MCEQTAGSVMVLRSMVLGVELESEVSPSGDLSAMVCVGGHGGWRVDDVDGMNAGRREIVWMEW